MSHAEAFLSACLLIPIVLALLGAYLVGSIPFGLLVARIVKGIDIRTVGSGNIGATNVARSIGKGWGALVLVLDALKGLLVTWLFPKLLADQLQVSASHLAVGCGLAAILGHMFPCWLKFHGGKGVATALGVVLVIAPWASLAALIVFAITFGVSRYVSLSSMLASLAFAVCEFVQLWPHPFSRESWSLALFALAVPLLIVIRHRSNIGRLLRGEEGRLREPPPPPADAG